MTTGIEIYEVMCSRRPRNKKALLGCGSVYEIEPDLVNVHVALIIGATRRIIRML